MDHIAVPDVAFHDLPHFFRTPHAVPNAFRIDDHRRAEGTGIETSRLVGPYTAFEPQALDLLFKYLRNSSEPLAAQQPLESVGSRRFSQMKI
jgi:hypothetical protein